MSVNAMVYFISEKTNLEVPRHSWVSEDITVCFAALFVRVWWQWRERGMGKHVKVIWLLLKSRLGRKHFLAVNHSLVLHSLKYFTQMTLTVLGVMSWVKRLCLVYILVIKKQYWGGSISVHICAVKYLIFVWWRRLASEGNIVQSV